MTQAWTVTRLHIDRVVVDANASAVPRPEVLERAFADAVRRRLVADGSVVPKLVDDPVLRASVDVDLPAEHGAELDEAVGRIAEVLLATLRGEVPRG